MTSTVVSDDGSHASAFLSAASRFELQEFEVLHFAQLINTRKLAFPHAPPYPPSRRAALTNRSKVVSLGIPPAQMHHRTKSDATLVSEKVVFEGRQIAPHGIGAAHIPITDNRRAGRSTRRGRQ